MATLLNFQPLLTLVNVPKNASPMASSKPPGFHAPPPTHVCKPRQGQTGTSDRMACQPACRSCFLDRLPAAKTAGQPSRHSSRTAVQTLGAAATAKPQCSSASFRRLGCSCFSRCETQRARNERVREAPQATAEGRSPARCAAAQPQTRSIMLIGRLDGGSWDWPGPGIPRLHRFVWRLPLWGEHNLRPTC